MLFHSYLNVYQRVTRLPIASHGDLVPHHFEVYLEGVLPSKYGESQFLMGKFCVNAHVQ